MTHADRDMVSPHSIATPSSSSSLSSRCSLSLRVAVRGSDQLLEAQRALVRLVLRLVGRTAAVILVRRVRFVVPIRRHRRDREARATRGEEWAGASREIGGRMVVQRRWAGRGDCARRAAAAAASTAVARGGWRARGGSRRVARRYSCAAASAAAVRLSVCVTAVAVCSGGRKRRGREEKRRGPRGSEIRLKLKLNSRRRLLELNHQPTAALRSLTVSKSLHRLMFDARNSCKDRYCMINRGAG